MARGRGVLRKRGDQFLYAELLERGAEINRRQVAMTISRRIKFGIAYLSQFRLFMQPLHAFGREDVLKLRMIETTELAHLAFKNAAITGRLQQAIGIKIINSLKLSPHADGPAHRVDIQRQPLTDLGQQSEGKIGRAPCRERVRQ